MSASTSGSTTQELAIRRILRAANHFDALQLERPHADLMEQPVWEVTGEQVHKAFRKLSLCCHPDKSTHPDAPRAFELLKKAKAVLSSELDRDDYLLNFVKQQRVNWEGNWATVEVAGEAKQRVTAMRQEAQKEVADRAARNLIAKMRRLEKEKVELSSRKRSLGGEAGGGEAAAPAGSRSSC